MNLIRPECRGRFTQGDFEFILSYLADGSGERAGLEKLLRDPETLDLILDRRDLFQALLELPEFVGISPRFYFYVIVRHTLLNAGFESRDLADYVASLLSEFSSAKRMRNPLEDDRTFDYLTDILQAIQDADESTRFLLSLHLGNYALFLSGIFVEYIRHRSERRAAPGVDYYESLGSSHYRIASDHRLARRYEIAPVLTLLSDEFRSTRQALNDLSERLLCWNEGGIG